MTARPSDRHTGPARAHFALTVPLRDGQHVGICRDCDWTGHAGREHAAALDVAAHIINTTPANPLLAALPPEPAEQPALF